MSKEVHTESGEPQKTDIPPSVAKETLRTNEGQVDYLEIGQENPDANPIVIVPGFTQGVEVLEDFGAELSRLGDRQVFVLDQLKRDDKSWEGPKPFSREGRLGLEQQTSTLLQFLSDRDLTEKPVDFIANSFGAPVAIRAAELADRRGWSCFKAEAGSRMALISPAASKKGEFLVPLGGRFAWWMGKNIGNSKFLDPDGSMMKAGIQNSMEDLAKTTNEVRVLARTRLPYQRLGEIGVKPVVFSYASDGLMPYRIMDSTLEPNMDQLSGIATIVDPENIGAGSFREFKQKTGLSGKAAREAWAHHYRRADHSDHQFHPKRSAKAVLQVFEGKIGEVPIKH
ncbi:MAG TPA: hypothetical protein VI336_03415 [Candidatus Saccharimonadales bacterium]|nr:hypothetical protein [Candidatus Saccharimonadales bacterium]